MSTKIISTNNGVDFSSVRVCVLCNPDGEIINIDGTSTGIKVVDTNSQKDFSSLRVGILIDEDGNNIP